MKWIAAILMIFNVLVFLGISDRQVEYVASQEELQPDVNGDSMLVLQEVYPELSESEQLGNPGSADAPSVVTDGDDLPGAVISDDALASLEVNSQGETTLLETEDVAQQSDIDLAALVPAESGNLPVGLSCYRVGPFKSGSIWSRANSWVQSQDIAITPVRSESRELRAVRVYVGPFESIAAAQGDVEILKQKELDYFVYLRDDNQARISLGYFTQEELSIKFVDYLQTQNIEAKSQPEYRTLGPFDWMDLEIEGERRRLILDRDWGDDDVETVERECA